ncbi:transglycosylase family protein [Streptomyces sp. DW26H14]|uniref:transglycosylase family protein n=1 Tax=Streptomyces sp. DW26H14 TaxID=3435395 RepID=UPI00403E2B0E
MSGNGRHRRPRQAPAIVVAAGVTGSAIAIPLLGAASASAADASTWDKVAACESGGVWSANLSNGYFGGLQISQDTWDQFGGSAYASRPDLATKSQQIAVAEKILAGEGSQTWADCADTAGLPKADGTSGSGDSDSGGGLGHLVGGLLGGSGTTSGTGTTSGSGSGDADGSTDPSGTPATGDSSGSATPDPSASSDGAGDTADPGTETGATGQPTPSTTPSDSASPDASGSAHGAPSATGGKHRAGSPSGAASTDDDGFPLSVSRDNSGGVTSGPATAGAGSVGNADQPGVVRDTGGAPVIRIPFAPRYPSDPHEASSPGALWQFPDEAAWAGQDAAPATDAPGTTPAGTPSGTPGAGAPAASGAPATGALPGPGATTTTPGPSGSDGAAGKHRGGAAPEASGPSATTATDSDSQTGQNGRHASSGDGVSSGTATPSGSDARYIVRSGDSLAGIAASRGVDGGWQALYAANKAALGSDPDHIVPGQTLDLGVG